MKIIATFILRRKPCNELTLNKLAPKLVNMRRKDRAGRTRRQTSSRRSNSKRQVQRPRYTTRLRAFAVLARMRNRGESLTHAARLEHATPRLVRKHVGRQLRRGASGRYSATRSDTLWRDLNVLGYEGYEPVAVRSSKQAQ